MEGSIYQFLKKGWIFPNFQRCLSLFTMKTGALNIVIRQHLLDYGISLNKIPYHISDCDTHILLCASGLCATLIPKMLSLRVHEHNAKCEPDKFIHIFPVKNFNYHCGLI